MLNKLFVKFHEIVHETVLDAQKTYKFVKAKCNEK